MFAVAATLSDYLTLLGSNLVPKIPQVVEEEKQY